MTPTLRPYPAYKDSGVPWLGKIPAHWSLLSNRELVRPRKHLVGARHTDLQLLSLTKQGVIIRDLTNLKGKFSADMGTSQEVFPGDLVFCLFDVPETPRTVGLSKHHGMITSAYTVFEVVGACQAEYFELFYVAMDDQKLLSPLYSGLRNTIPPSTFLHTKTPVPPLSEQQAIARFLDHIDGRVNRYIRAKRKLIALLNEQKQAIIHRAVTRGLDDTVPLRPSGVPWLGDIPAHWEVRRLKYLATKFGSGVTPRGGSQVYQEHGVPFLRSQNIHFDGLQLDGVACISRNLHEVLSGTHVKPGDVLLNITGASIGRVCSVPDDFMDGNVNQHVCIIRPDRTMINPGFLAAYLSTPFVQRLIRIEQSGASREGLTLMSIREFPVVIPSIEEQEHIMAMAENDARQLTLATRNAHREIDLLREYRTRLIADVVTGKLDVRAAALPDELTDTADDGEMDETDLEEQEFPDEQDDAEEKQE